MMQTGKRPLIFDIRRGSLDDGPGIRSVVFFKGCPLDCLWCHNPESKKLDKEISFDAKKCINCGDCQEVCPVERDNKTTFPKKISECRKCGKCVEICPTTALVELGKEYSAYKLVDILLKDQVFYASSGGGVTFSGGEPLFHMSYLGQIMRLLKGQGIHLAIETSGYFDLRQFKEEILPYTDLIYFDLKLYDLTLHQKYIGQDNALILDNLARISGYVHAGHPVEVLPRIPLIPRITATPQNMMQLAGFMRELGLVSCQLLPYNPSFMHKLTKLGKEIPDDLGEDLLSIAEIDRCKFLIEEYGIRVI